MRDTVKRWVRNYPLFDAIDVGTLQTVKETDCMNLNFFQVEITTMSKWITYMSDKRRRLILILIFLSSALFDMINSRFGERSQDYGDAVLDSGPSSGSGVVHVRDYISQTI